MRLDAERAPQQLLGLLHAAQILVVHAQVGQHVGLLLLAHRRDERNALFEVVERAVGFTHMMIGHSQHLVVLHQQLRVVQPPTAGHGLLGIAQRRRIVACREVDVLQPVAYLTAQQLVTHVGCQQFGLLQVLHRLAGLALLALHRPHIIIGAGQQVARAVRFVESQAEVEQRVRCHWHVGLPHRLHAQQLVVGTLLVGHCRRVHTLHFSPRRVREFLVQQRVYLHQLLPCRLVALSASCQ